MVVAPREAINGTPELDLVAGIVLCAMAITATLIRRLPLSTAMLYLPIGWALGPHGLGAVPIHIVNDAVRIALLPRLRDSARAAAVQNGGCREHCACRDRDLSSDTRNHGNAIDELVRATAPSARLRSDRRFKARTASNVNGGHNIWYTDARFTHSLCGKSLCRC